MELALLAAVLGLYGLMAYAVTRRTREIGVRIALGAERLHVRRMVLRQALALCLGGVGIGLVAAAVSTRLMASMLYGVSPLDPPTFAAVAGVLCAVALVASWVPARRAASVDPVTALRAEG